MNEYHMKLKFKGAAQKIALFNHILRQYDCDWPLTRKSPPICDVCGGVIYRAPRFGPEHIIGLSRQVAQTKLLPGWMKMKIKRFCTREVCEKERPATGVKKVLGLV